MNNTMMIAMRQNKDQMGFDFGTTSLKLKDLANSGFGILSQLIAGRSGTQVAVNSGGQLTPVNPNYGTPPQANYPQTTYPTNPNANNNQSPYNAAGDTASSLSGLITKYPWLPIAVIGVAYAWSRDPKKR